jgi:hypothetical protein
MYTGAELGQLWQVLTLLLNAGVCYMIFGLLFQAQRGWRLSHRPAVFWQAESCTAAAERIGLGQGRGMRRWQFQQVYFPFSRSSGECRMAG